MKKNLLVVMGKMEQAKQVFSSVYWNAGWKGDYMFLAHESEIPEKQLKWFRERGILVKKCKLIPNSEKLKIGKWLPVVFDVFYLFQPEFKKWKNLVFLEQDLIVKGSLEELTRAKGFAAVQGYPKLSELFLKSAQIRLAKVDKRIYNRLKKNYDLNVPSFNIGVMAFNTSIIKKDTFSKLKELLNSYIDVSAAGAEGTLNLYFYRNWEKLPFIYNLDPYPLINIKKFRKEDIKALVFHFHENKPWNTKNYFYKEWKNNLEKAELIDLKKIQVPARTLDAEEIKYYQRIVGKESFSIKASVLSIRDSADRAVGLFGTFLKSYHPKLYYQLKKLKER